MDAFIAAETTAPASAPAPEPVFYRCCADWEHSGYDDSDWHCVAYEATTGKLVRVETGTTRFANSLRHGGGVVPMIDEHRAAAREALIAIYVDKFTFRDRLDVEEPDVELLNRGTSVKFSAAHRCQKKERHETMETCPSCGGSKLWTNPGNRRDQRPCFKCNGTGQAKKVTYEKVKGENGRPVWEKIEAGAEGQVMGRRAYLQTWMHGRASEADRENTTVFVRLADGREIQAPATKLSLARPFATAEEIRRRADGPEGFYKPFATARASFL
jgi:hypothetical protein